MVPPTRLLRFPCQEQEHDQFLDYYYYRYTYYISQFHLHLISRLVSNICGLKTKYEVKFFGHTRFFLDKDITENCEILRRFN